MKVTSIKLLILVMLFSLSVISSSEAFNGASRKFTRGLVNILTAPVEVPKQVRSYWIQGSEKTFHISAWLFCGLVKGIVNTPVRLVSGVWDVVTFPFETSRDNQPLYKPEYVFDQWPQRKAGVVYKNMGLE